MSGASEHTGPEPVDDPAQPPAPGAGREPEQLQAALFEIRRVIVGQDQLLERTLIGLLTGGHLLIEGVPGLAKTLTVKTLAQVLGGTAQRIQFTPDLVPGDLVGTRIFRPDTASFETELGPVFCNLLLADEINRAPAKVQSALLEVMQERQVTIGPETYPVPDPFCVLATQNPIESEGTYPLPEAQVDRFMLNVIVDYPNAAEEHDVVRRSLDPTPRVQAVLGLDQLAALRARVADVFVDRQVIDYAVELAAATREPEAHGLTELEGYIAYGASPRGAINLVHGARALALLRGRDYVVPADVTELAQDVLRHRLVLTYDALADQVRRGALVAQVVAAVRAPDLELVRTSA